MRWWLLSALALLFSACTIPGASNSSPTSVPPGGTAAPNFRFKDYSPPKEAVDRFTVKVLVLNGEISNVRVKDLDVGGLGVTRYESILNTELDKDSKPKSCDTCDEYVVNTNRDINPGADLKDMNGCMGEPKVGRSEERIVAGQKALRVHCMVGPKDGKPGYGREALVLRHGDRLLRLVANRTNETEANTFFESLVLL